jgi:ubiquinol-cytochrome c reductase cytochrome b subunit
MKRVSVWLEDRTGLVEATLKVVEHPVPRKSASWWYIFGSGTLLTFIIQVVTGLVLASMYVPAPNDAYRSLIYITNEAPLGGVVRGIHNWGATLMIILIGIHMAQVFLFAAYKFPREVNWMSGVVLLAFTLAAAFTGQILRWDDNGVWTTTVLVKMVGHLPVIGVPLARFLLSGDVVNASTLSHFFIYHAAILPGLIIAVVTLHVFLVIRNGISEPPEEGRPVEPKSYRAWYRTLLQRDGVPFWPDVLWRDAVFAVLITIIVVVLAIFIGAPQLAQPPSPAIIDTNPRPDWYFLWLFSLLALLPPGVEFFILIGGSLLFFVIAFILPLIANRGERSPRRRPWALGVVVFGVALVGALTVLGLQAPWSPVFDTAPLPDNVVGVTSGPVAKGSQLFYDKGCQYCHEIAPGYGGYRGPNLTYVGDRLGPNELTWRIANGGVNMPAYASILSQSELSQLVAFLATRRSQSRLASPSDASSR